jgi:hypothetical protein
MLHKLPSAALAVYVVRSYGYTVRTSRAVLQDQMRETREEIRNAREASQRPGLEAEGLLFRFGSAAVGTSRDRVTGKGFWGQILFLLEQQPISASVSKLSSGGNVGAQGCGQLGWMLLVFSLAGAHFRMDSQTAWWSEQTSPPLTWLWRCWEDADRCCMHVGMLLNRRLHQGERASLVACVEGCILGILGAWTVLVSERKDKSR